LLLLLVVMLLMAVLVLSCAAAAAAVPVFARTGRSMLRRVAGERGEGGLAEWTSAGCKYNRTGV
jgi:hypothetical protein